MEKNKFFFSKQRLTSYKVLKDYLCEDLILKICDHSVIDKKSLYCKKSG